MKVSCQSLATSPLITLFMLAHHTLLIIILPVTANVHAILTLAFIPSRIVLLKSRNCLELGVVGRRKRQNLDELLKVETDLHRRGYRYIIGSDDTGGAGCIAGPVVVASCCVLKPFSSFLWCTTSSSEFLVSQSAMRVLNKVNDCKDLTPEVRQEIYDTVHSYPNIFAVSIAKRYPSEIDELNLSKVTQHAFAESIEVLADKNKLPFEETFAIVDGRLSPKVYSSKRTAETHRPFSVRPFVNGDAHVYTVALASILARVEHEKIMMDLHIKYPLYGFDQNFGFGTKHHIEAIHKHGAIENIHRMSFKQVKGR